MKRFIFIVGLPGSGKSFLGNEMSNENNVFLDDFFQNQDALKEEPSEVIIATDRGLCDPLNRYFVEKIVRTAHDDCEIQWIFFENDAEKCLKNAPKDINQSKMREWTQCYKIPAEVNPMEIWSKS